MGTEVLYPQDCLIQRIRLSPHRRKNYGNGNTRLRKIPVGPPSRFDNAQSQPLIAKRSPKTTDRTTAAQVTILRRGQPLDQKIRAANRQPLKKNINGFAISGAPAPVVSKQNRTGDAKLILCAPPVRSGGRADVYAGSAFCLSPAPSSLPLPSFFNKKQISEITVDDSATRDLRRLLRLE